MIHTASRLGKILLARIYLYPESPFLLNGNNGDSVKASSLMTLETFLTAA